MNLKNRLIVLFIIFLTCSFAATAQIQAICLTSNSTKKPFQVMLSFDNDDMKQGTAIYCNNKNVFKLNRSSYTLDDGGRQTAYIYKWTETYKGKKTGIYTFTLQGAAMYASFIRSKDKKEFQFTVDQLECDCK